MAGTEDDLTGRSVTRSTWTIWVWWRGRNPGWPQGLRPAIPDWEPRCGGNTIVIFLTFWVQYLSTNNVLEVRRGGPHVLKSRVFVSNAPNLETRIEVKPSTLWSVCVATYPRLEATHLSFCWIRCKAGLSVLSSSSGCSQMGWCSILCVHLTGLRDTQIAHKLLFLDISMRLFQEEMSFQISEEVK